jgi:hypothetical protein
MKFRRTNIALALAGAALAAAGTTATIGAQRAAFAIALVAPAGAAEQGDHGEYIRKNEGWLTKWTQKIDHFNEDVTRKSAKVKQNARKDLDKTWAEVKQRWADLKQASSDGWHKAKDAYEKSQRKLEEAWRDATS